MESHGLLPFKIAWMNPQIKLKYQLNGKNFYILKFTRTAAIRKNSVLFKSHWFVHTFDWIHIVPDWSNYSYYTTRGTAAVLVSLPE